jgi:hypothetical protein
VSAESYEGRVLTEAIALLDRLPSGSKLETFAEVVNFDAESAETFTQVLSIFLLDRFEEEGTAALIDAFMLGLFTAQAAANVKQQDALAFTVPEGVDL